MVVVLLTILAVVVFNAFRGTEAPPVTSRPAPAPTTTTGAVGGFPGTPPPPTAPVIEGPTVIVVPGPERPAATSPPRTAPAPSPGPTPTTAAPTTTTTRPGLCVGLLCVSPPGRRVLGAVALWYWRPA